MKAPEIVARRVLRAEGTVWRYQVGGNEQYPIRASNMSLASAMEHLEKCGFTARAAVHLLEAAEEMEGK